MSGNELDEYLSRFLKYKAEILHFAITSPISEMTAEACYDNTLFYKGFLLNAALQVKNQAQNDTLALPIYNTLIDYRRQIGYELTKPLEEKQHLSSLRHYADSLEKELVCMLSGNAALSFPVTWKEIRNQLSEEEVAIEFIHYQAMTPMATDSIMYVAQLIYHDSEKPILIPIFEEKDLWVLLEGYTVRKADFVNDFYAHRDRGPVRIGKRIDLYDIIWRPIHAVLRSNIKTIHIAPSGILHYLNFGAIPVTEITNLSDLYKINLLGSTRKLVPDLIMTENNTTKTGYIFSGIDYNATGFESNNAAEINSDNNQSTDVDINSSRNEQLSGAWANLYWTAFEGDSISSLLSSSNMPFYHFKNKDAREEEVKKLGEAKNASPGIIHFATHGFFYADKNATEDKQNIGSIFKSSENPMFRSGLIMAGANNAWENESSSPKNTEDGILTAYEISQLNLTTTELVVLSACETGLGDIQGNEGVYGLQRAFKIAGAKYLIMSLWQVPDRETMEFMTTFYRNWLEEKLTIPDAFRKTQREMRDRFFNPYSWAGFVLVK
jgi:CHAT domain-containing protein